MINALKEVLAFYANDPELQKLGVSRYKKARKRTLPFHTHKGKRRIKLTTFVLNKKVVYKIEWHENFPKIKVKN